MYLKTEGVDFRKIFIDELIKLAEKDDKIVFITCDVGFSFLEPLKERLGDRYKNFGVTEQSSMIIAAAMALSGLKPYIYSMINFMVFRPYEMVRNAVCYHNANVKILGVKGSDKYKFLGFSHNIVEDEDVHALQKMPNMNIYIPKTEEEVKTALLESYEHKKPTYIRL